MPLLIVTSSLSVGTDAPPHVAVALQFPDTEATLAAEKTDWTHTEKSIITPANIFTHELLFEF
jgi:hypothetical protein